MLGLSDDRAVARLLISDRDYLGSNPALVRTIFIFVKNPRRLTTPGEGNGKPISVRGSKICFTLSVFQLLSIYNRLVS